MKVKILWIKFLWSCKTPGYFNQFNHITKELNHENLHQISINGPHVNLNFYNEIIQYRQEKSFHSFIDFGSCILHVAHGSLEYWVEKTGFKKCFKWSLPDFAWHTCKTGRLHNCPSFQLHGKIKGAMQPIELCH